MYLTSTACLAGALGCSSGPPSDCASQANCAVDATTDVMGGGKPDAADSQADGGSASEASDAPMQGDTAGDVLSEASTCDPSASPHDAPCVIDDMYGVFVAPTGQDTAAGTKADPLKTIGEGIVKAAQSGRARVYVCQGNYAERVVLDSQHDGISLYGGLDCTNSWTYTGTAAQVQGPSALSALRIDSTSKPIAIEDMGFTAPDATGVDSTGNGNSSIAVFVSNETAGVTLRRVVLKAGNGAPGADGGVPPSNWFSADAGALQGNGADGGAGGAAKDCPCNVWGDTQGGAGGDAGVPNAGDGGAGTAMPAATPNGTSDGRGGAGFPAGSLGSCLGGHTGADGLTRIDGGAGASALGALTASGWMPQAGSTGQPGDPGQGGGGGGGGATGGGGGGGCGGCGGAGGLGGGGGGSSIALLIFNAVVDVPRASTIITSGAGKGGNGSTGENGGGGGGGGNVGACGGGQGGSGAGGQGGGGGAGGVSVGVVFNTASRVTIDATSTIFSGGGVANGGSPGGGGQGGTSALSTAPAGSAGTKGADGVSQLQMSL